MPVGIGTHADVNALGKNEGAIVGDRRPTHKHTVTVTDPGQSHTVSQTPHTHGLFAGANGAQNGTSGAAPLGTDSGAVRSTAGANANITLTGNTTGISVSVGQQSNVSADTSAFVSVPFIIKT